jgi:tetratricopeptide (TPR) repeat protein
MLLAAYAGVWLHGVVVSSRRSGFDPFGPRGRILAQRLGGGDYRGALPLAHELIQEFPDEPELLLAQARIWHGLGAWSQEAEAWEKYVRLSSTPAEACPALAEAHQAGKRDDLALRAYERCVRFDPDDPDRWFDLAWAYERRGRRSDAVIAWRKAAALDPDNPWIAEAIARRAEGQ